MKRIIDFLRTKHLYLGIVRYILGLYMLPYAISKILRTQLITAPHIWQNSHELLSGKALTWAFLGYSPWFQVLLGFFELIPALLLFFRRTTLLGAILLLPVSLNVMLINYALDLWDTTKIISLSLFCLNCLIFLFEWKRVWLALHPVLSIGGRLKFVAAEWVVNVLFIAVFVYFVSKPLLAYIDQKNELTGDWRNQHPIEWTLKNELLNDSTLNHREMKCYFGAYGMYNETSDSKFPKPSSYGLDTKNNKLTWYYDGYSPIKCDYKLLGDTVLLIEKNVDSTNRIKLRQYFSKKVLNYGASKTSSEDN